MQTKRLELGELLDGLASSGQHTKDVESDGLGEGPALANNDLVTGLDTESGGDVGSEVLVSLLITSVLGDEVEVLATDDQGSCTLISISMPSKIANVPKRTIRSAAMRENWRRTVHLCGHNCSSEDTATDRD
jgi:hypothetical protein